MRKKRYSKLRHYKSFRSTIERIFYIRETKYKGVPKVRHFLLRFNNIFLLLFYKLRSPNIWRKSYFLCVPFKLEKILISTELNNELVFFLGEKHYFIHEQTVVVIEKIQDFGVFIDLLRNKFEGFV
jgi:hypothetical protein